MILKGLANFFVSLIFGDFYSPKKYALFGDPRTFFDKNGE